MHVTIRIKIRMMMTMRIGMGMRMVMVRIIVMICDDYQAAGFLLGLQDMNKSGKVSELHI